MPMTDTVRPTGVSSNMLRGSWRYFGSMPDTATLVDVPISLQVPPSIEANATGIRNLEGGCFIRRATPSAGGTKIAVTVVLFIHADTAATAVQSPKRTRCG